MKKFWAGSSAEERFIRIEEVEGSIPSRSTATGGSRPAPTRLGTIVGLFKSECTKQIRRTLKNPHIIIWQRNYYENIIRTENDLNKIRQYIQDNPKTWDRDRNNPKNYPTGLGNRQSVRLLVKA